MPMNKTKDNTANKPTGLEIAVIGLAARFPGAPDIDAFWKNLVNGVESVVFLTEEEIIAAGVPEKIAKSPKYVKSKGAVLENKEWFDASFFGYTPAEAEIMDPQARVFHECVWTALEDAAYDPHTYNGKIGLYAGASPSSYWEALCHMLGKVEGIGMFSAGNLMNKDFIPTRVAYRLNLTGPSFSIQTACSTSLVAVHVACRALLLGECTLALAGGVSISPIDKRGYPYQDGMIMSADGHCRAFDEDSTGTISGEGAGVVVLKSLKHALRDRDHIYAVVKGTAINNDGLRKVGYTAPSVKGQMEAIRGALKFAKVAPDTIRYVEAHGTGTILGDPIEIESLRLAFATDKLQFCAIGSVKTNIGHLDAAAGVAGFIKTVLSLYHKKIPASLHFKTANPKINFAASPFYVNDRLRDFEPQPEPIRAGVSSFGIGGTNAHAVLEEAPRSTATASGEEPALFLLSAIDAKALERQANNLHEFLSSHPVNITDVAYTLQVGRRRFVRKQVFVAQDTASAIAILAGLHPESVSQSMEQRDDNQIVFMFPGQGAQYTGMSRELYRRFPSFKREIDTCRAIYTELTGRDIWSLIMEDDITRTDLAQPALFIVSYALGKLMMHWGLTPDAMVGHSIGEYAAACLAGVFTLREAIDLVVERGRLMQAQPAGAMISLRLPKERVESYLSRELSLAAVNSSSLSVVSGPHEAIDQFKKNLEAEGITYRQLVTSHAFHSTMMEPALEAFRKKVASLTLQEPSLPFISNLTGDWISAAEATSPDYWARHLREPVRFAGGVAELFKKRNSLFLETGPGNVLSTFVRQHSSYEPRHLTINLMRHPRDEERDDLYLLRKVGELWLAGATIDWAAFHEHGQPRRLSLPTYPFQRNYFWPEISDSASPISSFTKLVKKREVPKVEAETVNGDGPLEPNRAPGLTSPYAPPANQREQELADIWQRFLGIEHIGRLDDFFELGGDSLKAMNIISRIHKELDLDIPLTEFLKHSTIEGLNRYLDSRQAMGFVEIKPSEPREHYPLSAAQERLYILHNLYPDDTSYNMLQAYRLQGELEIDKLKRTFGEIISRHDSLRTSFPQIEGEPVQMVHSDVAVPLELKQAEPDEWEAVLRSCVRPFDFQQAPLMRVAVISTGPSDHYMLIDMHHIITDAVSQTVLVNEFRILYSGGSLPAPRLQYRDFCLWQSELFAGPGIKVMENYWLSQFQGDIPELKLPVDHHPDTVSHRAAAVEFVVDEDLYGPLMELTRSSETTLYMVLMAAEAILLAKYSRQEDIIIGSPITGRHHADLEDVIGVFVNMLAMRLKPQAGQTIADFLKQTKQTIVGALENQDYQFDHLVSRLGLKGTSGRNPLFNTVFNMINLGSMENREADSFGNLRISQHQFQMEASPFDLLLIAREADGRVRLKYSYKTALFDHSTIEGLAGHFIEILTYMTRHTDHQIAQIQLGHRLATVTAAHERAMDDDFDL